MKSDHEMLQRKLLLRPDEVQRILRISRGQTYELIDAGVVESTRAFGPVRVYARSLRKLLGMEAATE